MAHRSQPPDPDVFDNLRLELRRGCLSVAVLAALRSEQYGYTLRKLLAEHGLDVDEGTLYPLLRRLEAQGLRVMVPRVLSPNDGALSYGQAVVAAARLARG